MSGDLHICTHDYANLRPKDHGDSHKVLIALSASGAISSFELTQYQVLARTVRSLEQRGLIRIEVDRYPRYKVIVTEDGERYLRNVR